MVTTMTAPIKVCVWFTQSFAVLIYVLSLTTIMVYPSGDKAIHVMFTSDSIGSVSDLLLERNTQKHLLLSTKFTLPEESVSFVI
jgi:hypothetical protein